MIYLDVMEHLKVDLQIMTDTSPAGVALEAYLKSLIQTAHSRIREEGIVLDGSVADRNLVEQYAAYLYRSRKSGETTMPRALRYGLNNRLLSQKMKAGLA